MVWVGTRMLRVVLTLLMLLATLPARAEGLVADLSQNRVSITANFDGSEILIFGAVKHTAPGAAPLDVIVTVSGPMQPVTVRRKARVSGIWINRDRVEVETAPSFYAVSTTAPLSQILSDEEDQRAHVSVERAMGKVITHGGVEDGDEFSRALIRIRQDAGLYGLQEGGTTLLENTLFRTNVALPANLVEGDYTTRILLTRDGLIMGEFDTQISVRKVGLERWIYNLAHEAPLIYGVLSLFIAIVAGWGASAFFRVIRF